MSFTRGTTQLSSTPPVQVSSSAIGSGNITLDASSIAILLIKWNHATLNNITVSALSVADNGSLGSGITLVGSPVRATYGGYENAFQLAWLSVASAGTKQLDITFSASVSSGYVQVINYSATASISYDNQCGSSGTGTTASASSSNAANALIFAACTASSAAGSDPTPAADYTAISCNDALFYDAAAEDLDAAASQAVSFTLGGSAAWHVAAISFTEAGAPTTTTWEIATTAADDTVCDIVIIATDLVTVIENFTGVIAAGGFFSVETTQPLSDGDLRYALLHNADGTTTETEILSGLALARFTEV